MDNWKMINKIIKFETIISCDLDLIITRISWDQNGYLCTGDRKSRSYSLDNYRLITG
ncbi:conserved protein of unknown function [Vibrio tapetis subsp. tapetis]|uniref:Uncharacterized protein n=1 Tax=Vibrio tapetis subsp. tapetis TaxID=1671868 RepID=A0A2N8ZH48_9VIBR|nr:conserved protein of unknown function [Vibrio tapetis subsp. tapetis]